MRSKWYGKCVMVVWVDYEFHVLVQNIRQMKKYWKLLERKDPSYAQ